MELPDLKGMKILIIDGDELVRNAIRFLFREQKSHVDAFETAEEGLDAARREHYDLILCDYYLTGMDGSEFFNELRKLHSDAVKVLFTDYVDPEPLLSAFDAGIHAVIQKPMTIAALRDALVGSFNKRVKKRQCAMTVQGLLDNA